MAFSCDFFSVPPGMLRRTAHWTEMSQNHGTRESPARSVIAVFSAPPFRSSNGSASIVSKTFAAISAFFIFFLERFLDAEPPPVSALGCQRRVGPPHVALDQSNNQES